MLEGEYEFNTAKKEIIENTSFDVPANSSFKVKVIKITNYCCSYID